MPGSRFCSAPSSPSFQYLGTFFWGLQMIRWRCGRQRIASLVKKNGFSSKVSGEWLKLRHEYWITLSLFLSFRPFYRVEQIIMYPKSPEQIVDGPHGIPMGAVFHKSFIREVYISTRAVSWSYLMFWLVMGFLFKAFVILSRIRELSAVIPDGRRVTLDDVCFRPMGHDYDCMIFSPTNYFQVCSVQWNVQ